MASSISLSEIAHSMAPSETAAAAAAATSSAGSVGVLVVGGREAVEEVEGTRSTLMALASALQLRHADGSALAEWPGYGAAMTLEVWQQEQRSAGGSTALVA